MISTIFIILFLLAGLASFSRAGFIFYRSHKALSSGVVTVDQDYNAVFVFVETMDSVVQFLIKKAIRMYKFSLHYVVLWILQSLDLLKDLIENRYQSLRARFVTKSVENKAFVVHFWSHLKHYKREMDKEEEDVEK